MPYDNLSDQEKQQLAMAMGVPPDGPLASYQPATPLASYQPSVPQAGPAPDAGAAPATSPEGKGFLASLWDRISNPQLLPFSANPTPSELEANKQSPSYLAAQQKAIESGLVPAQNDTAAGPGTPDMSRVSVPRGPGQAPEDQGTGGPDLSRFQAQTPQTSDQPGDFVDTTPPGVRADLEEARANQLEGTQRAAEAQGHLADQQAEVLRGARERFMNEADADRKAQESFRTEQDQHYEDMAKREKLLAEKKIDPDHFMASKSTWQRIALAIAQGLAAFGSAATHTPNVVAEMISKDIDRDIEAQKAEIDSKKGALQAERGLYADKVRLFGDTMRAHAAARQEYLAMASTQVDEMAKTAASPIHLAQAQAIQGQIQERIAREDQKLQVPVTEDTLLNREAKRTEIAHTKAETEALTEKANAPAKLSEREKQAAEQGQKLAEFGRNVERAPQTSATGGHPLNFLAAKLGLQGKEGTVAQGEIDEWNSQMRLILHAQGVRLGDASHADRFIKQTQIGTNDNAETRRRKVQLGLDLAGAAAAQPARAIPGFRPAGASRETSDRGPPGPTMSRRELEQVAAQAGFQNPRIAAAIAMAESGGHVGAIGDQRLGGSFGLWQVHRPSHPEYDPHRLRNDPLYAARAAYEISKGGQDFSPWTTFRNGAFRRYLTDQQP